MDSSSGDTGVLVKQPLDAFSGADLEGMRSLLADDLVAYVTNADGGMDRVDGAAEYLSRVRAMDLSSARFSVTLTQVPVVVDAENVLAMVEIRAARRGKSLHNFAAHMLRIRAGRVVGWWMTDAKPAESDEFWS